MYRWLQINRGPLISSSVLVFILRADSALTVSIQLIVPDFIYLFLMV